MSLAAIEARLTADRDDFDGGWTDQTIRDREHLLAMVREQGAALVRVEAVAEWVRDNHGDYISREIEDRLRAAITATEGA